MDVQTGLILGNSITLHSPCSYWWGSWGMAASSAEHDFVHILANMQDKCPPPCKTAPHLQLLPMGSHGL